MGDFLRVPWPLLSPDGRTVAIVPKRDGAARRPELWLFDVATGKKSIYPIEERSVIPARPRTAGVEERMRQRQRDLHGGLLWDAFWRWTLVGSALMATALVLRVLLRVAVQTGVWRRG